MLDFIENGRNEITHHFLRVKCYKLQPIPEDKSKGNTEGHCNRFRNLFRNWFNNRFRNFFGNLNSNSLSNLFRNWYSNWSRKHVVQQPGLQQFQVHLSRRLLNLQ